MNQALESKGYIPKNFSHIAHQGLLPYMEQRKPLTFEQFYPFICLEGLDPRTATFFLNFLQALFEITPRRLWYRESCCGAVDIARNAGRISSNYFQKQTIIHVLMGSDHFWSVVKQPNQSEIVVDPAGILDPELEAVLPYFGVPDACSFEGYPLRHAKCIYNGGQVLTPEQEESLLRYQETLLQGI